MFGNITICSTVEYEVQPHIHPFRTL